MGIDHVFDRVGNNISRGQAVEHAVVAHSDSIIDGDRIELLGNTARGFDFSGHELSHVFEVHMARNKLRERVHYGNNRFFKIAVGHAGSAPQGSGTGHVAACGRCFGSVLGHSVFSRAGREF